MKSKLFRLNWLDVLKGILLGTIASVVDQLLNLLTDPAFHITWKSLARMFLVGFLSYLAKNFFTPSPKKNADA